MLNLNIIKHVYIIGTGRGLVGCYSLHGPENYSNALNTCSSAEGYVVNVDSWEEDTAVTGNVIDLCCYDVPYMLPETGTIYFVTFVYICVTYPSV